MEIINNIHEAHLGQHQELTEASAPLHTIGLVIVRGCLLEHLQCPSQHLIEPKGIQRIERQVQPSVEPNRSWRETSRSGMLQLW